MTTRYLTFTDVEKMHRRQIELFGGSDGVRDAGLIEAALMRPQTGYYADLIEEAAALWESLTMNGGFVDGNKRIGFAAMYVFLRMNGYRLEADADAAQAFILGALEAGTFTKDVLDAWLRDNVRVE